MVIILEFVRRSLERLLKSLIPESPAQEILIQQVREGKEETAYQRAGQIYSVGGLPPGLEKPSSDLISWGNADCENVSASKWTPPPQRVGFGGGGEGVPWEQLRWLGIVGRVAHFLQEGHFATTHPLLGSACFCAPGVRCFAWLGG